MHGLGWFGPSGVRSRGYRKIRCRNPSSAGTEFGPIKTFERQSLRRLPCRYFDLLTWIDDGRELLCEDVSIKRSSDLYKLELLVRDVFESYENHYFSNPVFQTDLVLSGYVEWAQRNCSTVGSYILLSEPSDEEVGFATVAWNEDVPNVELAGIRSNMRGKGHYRNLMLAIMQETRIAEKSSVQISTQVTNLIVQRAWASLGWKPTEVQETIHLVRGDLVRGVWS